MCGKRVYSFFCKQCRPRSEGSFRSPLIRVSHSAGFDIASSPSVRDRQFSRRTCSFWSWLVRVTDKICQWLFPLICLHSKTRWNLNGKPIRILIKPIRIVSRIAKLLNYNTITMTSLTVGGFRTWRKSPINFICILGLIRLYFAVFGDVLVLYRTSTPADSYYDGKLKYPIENIERIEITIKTHWKHNKKWKWTDL